MPKVHDQKTLILFLVAAVLVVLAVNFISRDLFFRLDFTDNKMYSLSESSQKVVRKIDDRLTMKVYFSDNLPGQYGNNRRYLQDILEEYEAYGEGNIRFEFYLPEDDEQLEEEAQKYGIQPVRLQVVENDNLEVKKVYMGMVFLYGDERLSIPVIQTTTGLEYEITTQIKKLTDPEKARIAFATIGDQKQERKRVSEALQQSYRVQTLDLGTEIPGDINLVIIGGVEDSISTEDLDHVKDFLDRGGNLFIAQSRIKSNLQSQMGTPIKSNFFDFLDGLGLKLEENLVLDQTCANVTVSQTQGFFRVNSQMRYPFFPLIRNFGDHLTVGGLEQVRMIFPSEIAGDDDSSTDSEGSTVTPLLFTSKRSGTMSGYYRLSPLNNPAFRTLVQKGKIVGALATVKSDRTENTSQIILVSDSRFFDDSGGGSFSENYVFIANAADYLMGDSDLVSLRSREITTRPLAQISDPEKSKWKWANILVPPVLIIGYGIFRRNRRTNRAKVLEEIYG